MKPKAEDQDQLRVGLEQLVTRWRKHFRGMQEAGMKQTPGELIIDEVDVLLRNAKVQP